MKKIFLFIPLLCFLACNDNTPETKEGSQMRAFAAPLSVSKLDSTVIIGKDTLKYYTDLKTGTTTYSYESQRVVYVKGGTVVTPPIDPGSVTRTFTLDTIPVSLRDAYGAGRGAEQWHNGSAAVGISGSGAIVQAVTNSADATADPNVTLAAISSGSNAVIAWFANDINPMGGTVEAGWTEDFDNGYASPDRGDYSMYRLTTTDNTPTVTAASSDWAGIAIEIKALTRRRVIID